MCSSDLGPPPGRSATTGTAKGYGRPSADWSPAWGSGEPTGTGDGGRRDSGPDGAGESSRWSWRGAGEPRKRPWPGEVAQRPYACLQMTDSGLSACQPPYCRPSAHRSFVFFGTELPTPGIFTGGWWWCRCFGCGARGCGRGRERGADGFPAGAFAAGPWCCGVLGSGRRDGPIISSASLAGACTVCGSRSPSGRGADGWDGAVGGGPERGGRWTVTQPVRAATATVTRSVAVVVVRCTRSTMAPPPAPRNSGGAEDAPHG